MLIFETNPREKAPGTFFTQSEIPSLMNLGWDNSRPKFQKYKLCKSIDIYETNKGWFFSLPKNQEIWFPRRPMIELKKSLIHKLQESKAMVQLHLDDFE